MNKFYSLILFTTFLLTSCASPHHPTPSNTLAQEAWMRQVDMDSTKWTQGASPWFLTGEYNVTEPVDPEDETPISTTTLKAPVFDKIRVDGNFTVQLYGTTDANSVYVYGPNELARHVRIEIHDGMLRLMQDKDSPTDMHRVIIRIGIKQLHYLCQMSCARIEGIRLQSDKLTILSTGGGKIYLVGELRVRDITNTGRGTINVFGVNTSHMHIKTSGSGNVNVSGRVGVRTIVHHGKNDINVLGATSPPLKIYADGMGKVAVYGSAVNLQEVQSKEMTRVYVYHVASPRINVSAAGKTAVGLAGHTHELFANLYGSSRFYGRHLCAIDAYVRTHDTTHMNVSATHKIAASATDSSSIYFYGTPEQLSQYTSSNAIILAISPRGGRSCSQPVMAKPYAGAG